MVDEGQQHPERGRFYTRSTQVDDGLPCALLVVEGDDGCAKSVVQDD